jgi:uracil-DNA glycosylase family 4
MPTRFALHVEQWKDCQRCKLAETRNKVVISRGKVPCDILLLGEGPGASEDVLGKPFVGPAGQLLDEVIRRACRGLNWEPRFAFTNLVCCIPLDDEGDKTAEPEDECVLACQPRLKEFIEIANPRLIVCVGKLAEDWTSPGYKYAVKFASHIHRIRIDHPAYLLRLNVAQKGLKIQTNIVDLRNALEDLSPNLDPNPA